MRLLHSYFGLVAPKKKKGLNSFGQIFDLFCNGTDGQALVEESNNGTFFNFCPVGVFSHGDRGNKVGNATFMFCYNGKRSSFFWIHHTDIIFKCLPQKPIAAHL